MKEEDGKYIIAMGSVSLVALAGVGLFFMLLQAVFGILSLKHFFEEELLDNNEWDRVRMIVGKLVDLIVFIPVVVLTGFAYFTQKSVPFLVLGLLVFCSFVMEWQLVKASFDEKDNFQERGNFCEELNAFSNGIDEIKHKDVALCRASKAFGILNIFITMTMFILSFTIAYILQFNPCVIPKRPDRRKKKPIAKQVTPTASPIPQSVAQIPQNII